MNLHVSIDRLTLNIHDLVLSLGYGQLACGDFVTNCLAERG